MVKFVVEREIDVSREAAWTALCNFGHVHSMHPMIDRVTSASGEEAEQEDQTRTCHLISGKVVQERRTKLDASDMTFSYNVVDTRAALHRQTTTITVERSAGAPDEQGEDEGDGKKEAKRTEMRALLVAECEVTCKVWLVGLLIERVFLRRKVGRYMNELFAGVRQYVVTGQAVTRFLVPDVQATIKKAR